MAWFGLPLLLAANALITDGMTEDQRLKVLSRHIDPAPGKKIRIADYEIRDRKAQDGPKLRGFIHFNPPRGSCFTVTRWPDQDDDVVCKPTDLSFSIKDLTRSGHLRWRISTGSKDFGQEYSWSSDYRLAQTIKAGDNKSIDSTDYALLNCKLEVQADHYVAHLGLHKNRRWTIKFPKVGKRKEPAAVAKVVEKPKDESHGEKPEAPPKKKDEAPPPPPPKNKTALERWQIPEDKSFVMPASNFKAADAAPGLLGECRYSLKGAIDDPESGWIECHNTELFDVVFVHLPCTKGLPTP